MKDLITIRVVSTAEELEQAQEMKSVWGGARAGLRRGGQLRRSR